MWDEMFALRSQAALTSLYAAQPCALHLSPCARPTYGASWNNLVCPPTLQVPGDNFVPGIVMGGLSGRLFGELLREAGIYPGLTPGAFALLGAGAVLTGMSRMTITLVAILTEARMQRTCK